MTNRRRIEPLSLSNQAPRDQAVIDKLISEGVGEKPDDFYFLKPDHPVVKIVTKVRAVLRLPELPVVVYKHDAVKVSANTTPPLFVCMSTKAFDRTSLFALSGSIAHDVFHIKDPEVAKLEAMLEQGDLFTAIDQYHKVEGRADAFSEILFPGAQEAFLLAAAELDRLDVNEVGPTHPSIMQRIIDMRSKRYRRQITHFKK